LPGRKKRAAFLTKSRFLGSLAKLAVWRGEKPCVAKRRHILRCKDGLDGAAGAGTKVFGNCSPHPASAKLLINNPFSGQVPDLVTPSSTNKSIFASFSEDKRRVLVIAHLG
jgi:hypothetical protein